MAMEEVRSYKFSPRTNIDLKTLNFDRMIGNSSVSFKSFGLQCARKSDNSSNLLISSQNESKCKFVPRYHPDDDGKNFTVTKEEPEMFRVKTRNGTNSKGKPLEHSGSDLLFHRRIDLKVTKVSTKYEHTVSVYMKRLERHCNRLDDVNLLDKNEEIMRINRLTPYPENSLTDRDSTVSLVSYHFTHIMKSTNALFSTTVY